MGEINSKNQTAVGLAANTEKDAILADIANKIQALDNPVKLSILSLLVESGSLSITDISKKLNINFSTAHKYLEQLEAAQLVTSKQIADNRLKRMFFIKDFSIELSPKSLFQRSADAGIKSRPKFKLFDNGGVLVDYDEEKFSQKYIKRGMPRGTVLLGLQEILLYAYNGITLHELRQLFKQALEKKAENVTNVFDQIDKDINLKRTFTQFLGMVHPEALTMHNNGQIFIKNLRYPGLFCFVHDLDGILEHGISGKTPKTCKEFLKQVEIALNSTNFILNAHGLDCFNCALAECADLKSTDLEEFLDFLEKVNIPVYLGLELGAPDYAKNKNCELIRTISESILNSLKAKHRNNIIPVLKIWDKKEFGKDYTFLKKFVLLNMTLPWQKDNASFVDGTRFDASWRGEYGTKRIGLAQEIVLNLPRIAAQSKDKKEFTEKLILTIKNCANFNLTMMELTMGEFLKNYKVMLPSETGGSWLYTRTMDFEYAVSLTGLNEAAKTLNLEPADVEKILQTANKEIKTQNYSSVRLVLKENNESNISRRFYSLDLKENPDMVFKNYTPGTYLGTIEATANLQESLSGGHCLNISAKEYHELLNGGLKKLDFGAIQIQHDN